MKVSQVPLTIRKWFYVISLITITTAFSADETSALSSSVDRRFELLSIVARLADFEEFKHDGGAYPQQVDAHFRSHLNHPVIQFAQKLRREKKIGFDSIPGFAAHLTPAPEFRPILKIADTPLAAKWGETNALHFADLLKNFYETTQCADFFAAQSNRYVAAAAAFQPVLQKIQYPWFRDFFGPGPARRFHVVIGMLNGPGNFASLV